MGMQSLKSRFIHYLLKRRLAQMRALNLPLPESRSRRDSEADQRFKMPAGVRIEPVQIAGLPGAWLHPEAPQACAGLTIYLHGGAYVQGSIKTHRTLAARLALASGLSTLIVDYRLAPEHPFPAALDDAVSVFDSLQAAHPGRSIALAGDSAGGGLALSAALRIREAGGLRRPAALALLSPWTDLSLSNPTHASLAAVDPYFPTTLALRTAAAAYAGNTDLKNPFISPQFADLCGLPPTLIHVGALEALLDDSRVLAARMRNSGVDVELKIFPGMWHVWQIFGGQLLEANQSLRELGQFLKNHSV